MSETQLVIVTEAECKIYRDDGLVAALTIRIDELRKKRTVAVYEIARFAALLQLAEQNVSMIDFHLQELLQQKLKLLEAR